MQRPQNVHLPMSYAPGIAIAATRDFNRRRRADVRAASAANAGRGVIVNRAAILIAGALVFMRQAEGDRALTQIVKNEAKDIHSRNLM